MRKDLEHNCHLVARAIVKGRLVPFLGAGANLCDRPPGQRWCKRNGDYLPGGTELAKHLADEFNYPSDEPIDLARVCQYIEVMTGAGDLFDELRALFTTQGKPTTLHRLLAELPRFLRDGGYPEDVDAFQERLLFVTTNYDDLLEQALRDANEEFHLVSYVGHGQEKGYFRHVGKDEIIRRPNEYLLGEPNTVVLKIHGTVDKEERKKDSYIITEDHYIEYLTRTRLQQLFPLELKGKLLDSHLLFLGYGLHDWNLRVILHRIWNNRKFDEQSWAINLAPPVFDCKYWSKRRVDILDTDLAEYVVHLRDTLRSWGRRP